MLNATFMPLSAIRRRAGYAPGLLLLAAVLMPAPAWAGDYTLAWRDGAWVERRADCRPAADGRRQFWRPPACIAGQADDSLEYEWPRVAVNGVALSPFADMHRVQALRVLQCQAETLHVFRVWGGGRARIIS